MMQQQQSMMATYASQNQVTTEVIQQYLDENKQLILAILENQNAGKAEECAQNQAKLQRNLMYLAAIADTQPQVPIIAQNPPNTMMQSGACYVQLQQAQPLTPQSVSAARSPMSYAQSPSSLSVLQQQQQAAMHRQLGANSGFSMLHGETRVGGNAAVAAGAVIDFGRSSSSGKLEAENALPTVGQGGQCRRA